MSSRKTRGLLGVLLAAVAGILVLALPAAASARDRNHDKIPDRWEKHFNLSLKVNQAHRDQDRDGLANRQEFRAGTNPRDADTNDDGVPDDEENAGTIASFDGTTLTINLFAGGSVSAMVTPGTEIQCESRQDTEDGDHGDGGGGDGVVMRDDGGSGGGGDEGNCTTADLTPGTVVHEAEIDVTSAGATFEEVDLVSNTVGDDD